jgi:8-oxo-dGTP pyrophosphatase MutT (NUDIX family)
MTNPPNGSRERADDPRLDLTTPLTPGDAVACIIVADGQYLLQLRDLKRGIFFPGVWGCFGGGVDPGETEQQALARELQEELGFTVAADGVTLFSRFDFDLAFAGLGTIWRMFYELEIPAADLRSLRLNEGSEFRLFPPEAILTGDIQLTPYDAFALWLHINRGRLAGSRGRHGNERPPRAPFGTRND